MDTRDTTKCPRDNFHAGTCAVLWSYLVLLWGVPPYVLDTPQVTLGVRARRMAHYPPERCEREHCSVNFNFDLNEHGGYDLTRCACHIMLS